VVRRPRRRRAVPSAVLSPVTVRSTAPSGEGAGSFFTSNQGWIDSALTKVHVSDDVAGGSVAQHVSSTLHSAVVASEIAWLLTVYGPDLVVDLVMIWWAKHSTFGRDY
jgi:hypothetical protein